MLIEELLLRWSKEVYVRPPAALWIDYTTISTPSKPTPDSI